MNKYAKNSILTLITLNNVAFLSFSKVNANINSKNIGQTYPSNGIRIGIF